MDTWEQEQIATSLRKAFHGFVEMSLPSYLIAMVLLAAAVPMLVLVVEAVFRFMSQRKGVLAIGKSIRSHLRTFPGRYLTMILFYTWLAISIPLGALFMTACIAGKRADQRSDRIARNQISQEEEEKEYRDMARDIISKREEKGQGRALPQPAS